MNVTFAVIGEPEDGNYTASVRFPQTIGSRRGCPAKDFQLVGTLVGERLEGRLLGTQLWESRSFVFDFVDNDTAMGTYEVTSSDSSQGASCPGETGTMTLSRFIE